MPYWFRYFDILPLRLWLVILLFVLFAWVGRVAFGRWQRAGLVLRVITFDMTIRTMEQIAGRCERSAWFGS